MVAYAAATFIVAFAYPRKQLKRVILALICYAAALEFLQDTLLADTRQSKTGSPVRQASSLEAP